MIHVFFVPGMFGSTIEFVARSFSNELDAVEGRVNADGSMHSFLKQAHLHDVDEVNSFFNSDKPAVDITTPIYPFREMHFPEILKKFNNYISDNDIRILVHANTIMDAEINMLFQYHKIVVGLNYGLDLFCNGNEHNIVAWNPAYTHWRQMQSWQLREWISMFYTIQVQEWIDSQYQTTAKFLTVRNTDFLSDPLLEVSKIFNHCNLTQKSGLEEFLQIWKMAQKYVIDEFELLGNIVNSAINNQSLTWEPTNIIAESIVQQRLRALGYEIRCDGLNTFPTNSRILYNLLEKV